MASFTFTPSEQGQLFSVALCKWPSTLCIFKSHFPSHFLTFSPTKRTILPVVSPPLAVRARVGHVDTKQSSTDQELSNNTKDHGINEETVSGFSSFRSKDRRSDKKFVRNNVSSAENDRKGKRVAKDGETRERFSLGSRKGSTKGFMSSSARPKDVRSTKKMWKASMDNSVGNVKIEQESKRNDDDGKLGEKKIGKVSKRSKVDSPGAILRVGLDMCSKRGDVIGAIELYDSARREGIKMGQYHYTVLLYLCSSAATGVVQPAKSGSGGRSLTTVPSSDEIFALLPNDFGEVGEMGAKDSTRNKSNFQSSNGGLLVELGGNSDIAKLNNGFQLEFAHNSLGINLSGKENSMQLSNGYMNEGCQVVDGVIQLQKGDISNSKNGICDHDDKEILVDVDVKRYALQRGFEIYETMCLDKIPMNEAALTSVARMAMSMGNGDMAFDMVKQMKALGINPRLRSYSPALSVFCNNGDIEKAFIVEGHMLEHRVYPEEPELELLLRVSIEAGRSDKVYYLLHKLRTGVRKVSPSTADLIEKWFKSKNASRVGKRKWDQRLIREAIENGGGGWHGQGWLGKGKWTVSHTSVGADGLCKYCGEKLVTIDLDPTETDNFAESVASFALQREKNSSFQKFQKWLDYYGPFEAVVDAANVGLFSQRKFKPSKVNAIVNGIRQMLPSKKWPLIVLHNRRITGDKMNEPVNRALIEKWKNADALYATPTGSNDDWYWLYAAIKFKCLIVTNDEMRDHLFQLLGNDFFPRWKERHQVHFSFSDTGPAFHMPPPCSVIIQESERGHWHIPIISEHDLEGERAWLCITRVASDMPKQASVTTQGEFQFSHQKKGHASLATQTETQSTLLQKNNGCHENAKHQPQETYGTLRNILSAAMCSTHPTILSEIEAAEQHGSCVIDFQI